MEKILSMYREKEEEVGFIILDSPGGDYFEGIKFGLTFFEYGWGTKVKSGDMCMSACAFAFLGGKNYGASKGWLPVRMLEAGAILGFHPFYARSNDKVNMSIGIETGRIATNLLYAYITYLNIKPDIIVNIMQCSKENFTIVNTPYLLKNLDIKLLNFNKPINDISNSNIINIVKEILYSKYGEEAWEFDIKLTKLSENQFKKEMINRVINCEDSQKYSSLKLELQQALKSKDSKVIDTRYKMLQALNTLPYIFSSKPEIIKIDGLNNVHQYLSTTAYLFINNYEINNLSIEYLLAPQRLQYNSGYVNGHLDNMYGIIYELFPPHEPLWKIEID